MSRRPSGNVGKGDHVSPGGRDFSEVQGMDVQASGNKTGGAKKNPGP